MTVPDCVIVFVAVCEGVLVGVIVIDPVRDAVCDEVRVCVPVLVPVCDAVIEAVPD